MAFSSWWTFSKAPCKEYTWWEERTDGPSCLYHERGGGVISLRGALSWIWGGSCGVPVGFSGDLSAQLMPLPAPTWQMLVLPCPAWRSTQGARAHLRKVSKGSREGRGTGQTFTDAHQVLHQALIPTAVRWSRDYYTLFPQAVPGT